MSSLSLTKESLEYKLKSQAYLLSCIDEEESQLEKEKNDFTNEEYNEAFIELAEYKSDVLSEMAKCQKELNVFEEENKNLVLRQMGFKKGGQSW